MIEKVEINVKLYVETFLKKRKTINYIGIYWPLKMRLIWSLNDKYSLALPRCAKIKALILWVGWYKLTKDYEDTFPDASLKLSYKR